MKSFKQFSKQINENRENLMELDRELTAAGLFTAKYGPKIGSFAIKKGKQLLSIANKGMNVLDKTYGKGLQVSGSISGTKSALEGKPKEALRNYSSMFSGGNVFNKLKKFKNLGRLGSTAQSINRYSTKAASNLDRVIGGTADKLTGDKYDFDGRGKGKNKR
tara:strand:- start:77 stop:562 length:486 start_codon:yes stop_codon:yes gene_type:complete